MLDKELIKKKFIKSLLTYNSNAFVQKIMADELIELLNNKKYKNILEIGSYTGILTEKLVLKNPDFENYTAVDIISQAKKYVNKINNKIEFINADIENFKTDKKFDLIIANASLQWCDNLDKVIKKLQSFLAEDGVIALSLFSKKNFFEIKDIFNVGLNYPSIEDIKAMFLDNVLVFEKEYELKFDDSFDILRHLKSTGVNALTKEKFSIKELKEKLKLYKSKYQNKLTYNPLYVKYLKS